MIGVDLGGTKIAVATLRGPKLSDSALKPTNRADTDALIDQLAETVESCRSDALDAVGVGVPSVVEFDTGRIVSTVNLPLTDVPLREVLGERIGVPVFVDNDATVAALAEAHDEEMRMVARSLVMITVGTGVGGGLVLGGRIYRGATGGAGELGHTLVGLDLTGSAPPPGRFPQHGSLERLAAGRALDALVEECIETHPSSMLARMRAEGHEVLGAEAVTAAQDGDRDAAALVERWAERLGIGVANAINTFDPDEVVIGGGAARAGDLLLEPVRRVAAGYLVPGLGERTTIRLARHGVRAGVLGAALLAAHELEDAAAGDSAAGHSAPGDSEPASTNVTG
ncbi:MAG TPA: ROK family protein [Solirubrobacteraceae bacterium]